jgi:nucleotide-binding universal stress UspA family protein
MRQTQSHTRTPGRRSTNGAPGPEFRVHNVFVAVGNRAQAPLVLAVGRTLATAEGATLHALPMGVQVGSPDEMAAQLEVNVEQLNGCVFDFPQGDPVEYILRRTTEFPHALLVLPAQLSMGKPPSVLGPLIKDLLLRSTVPIVLVPPGTRKHSGLLQRILLPHDGTPTTAAAVGPAMYLARQCAAELIAVHVAAPGHPQPSEPGTLTTPYYTDQPQYEWPAWAQEFLERIRAVSPDISTLKLRLLLAAGRPGLEIVNMSRECDVDLTVLSWRGSWRAQRAAVMKTVVRESRCPVLLIRLPSTKVEHDKKS